MTLFNDYIESIRNTNVRKNLESIFNWVDNNYPQFKPVIKWNQPMYTHHDTYIVGFSKAKAHLNIGLEERYVPLFLEDIKKAGYQNTKMLVQIKDNQEVDYNLLKKIIDFIVEDKKDVQSFWR